MNQSRREILRVDARDADQRLDIYLARALPDLSRSRLQQLIRKGCVRLDGRSPRVSALIKADSLIELEIPPPVFTDMVAEDLPLSVVFEDASLIVIDKPAGMVVHPSAGHPRGTLVNALLHHCADLSGIGGALRPGIVHRMDKGTSGLLVVAKSDAAHHALAAQFKAHSVDREYLAVVWGRFKSETGRFDWPVGRHPRDRKRMSVSSRRGKDALTLFRVEREIGSFTLLRLRLGTGRTHQIRVHLAASGHPVVGDPTYGGGAVRGGVATQAVRQAIRALSRPALHATTLGFDHPVSRERLRFNSPLPTELLEFLEVLGAS